MKNYKILLIILIVILSVGLLFNYFKVVSQAKLKEPFSSSGLQYAKSLIPEADNFSTKVGHPTRIIAYQLDPASNRKQKIGYIFSTQDTAPDIIGYTGPITMLVAVDLNDYITGIKIISHAETPVYADKLDSFVEQFKGKRIDTFFKIGQNIDGISQATVSSQAIVKTINESAKILSNQSPDKNNDTAKISLTFWLEQIIIPILIFSFAIVGFLFHSLTFRWLALLSSLIYLGFIKATMFSVIHIINFGLFKFPSFLDFPMLYLIIIFTFITLFLFGNLYCGSICPYGALQEIIYNFFKELRPKKKPLQPVIERHARYAKYIILFVLLIVCFIVGNSDAAQIEAFILFFSFKASKLGWALVEITLIAAIFSFRFWCKYFCPIGAFNGLLARYAKYKINLLDKECGGCHNCERICPTQAIDITKENFPHINYAECILCTKCVRKCPKSRLKIVDTNEK